MSGDVDPDIPSTGAVFTFGKSRFADNVPSHFFIKNDPIVDLACGDQHTAVVCQNGRVFTFGSNEWGQLGLGHSNPIYKPSCLKSIKSIKCTNVALGRAHTLIRTAEGELYCCGANSEGQLGLGDTESKHMPQLIESIHSVKAVAAGSNHSVAITDGGDVYAWGSNSEGQLGLGKETNFTVLPTKLELTEPISHLAAGYYHTLLLTETGIVWSTGEGDGGRLGLGHEESSFVPQKVQIPDSVIFTSLAAGGSHSLALDAESQLYVWGSNEMGQLAQESEGVTSLLEPSLCLVEKKFQQISAGQQHSAFVTEGGGVLICGETRHGKLGTELPKQQYVSRPTHIPKLISLDVVKVACGGCHTAVLAAPRNLPICQILIENSETTQSGTKSLPPLVKKISNSNLLNPPDQVLSPPLNHVQPAERQQSLLTLPDAQDGSEEDEDEETIRTSSMCERGASQAWERNHFDTIETIETQESNQLEIENNAKNTALNQSNETSHKKGQNEGGKISRFFSRLRKSPSINSGDIKEMQNGHESNGKETSNVIISHEDDQTTTSKKSKMCIIL